MPVNVYFLGLICHINASDHDDGESFAAVINAPEHKDRIWSRRNGEIHSQKLSHNVEFGLQPGLASTNNDFKTLVPNLRNDRLTRGRLLDFVRGKGQDADRVHSYVIYPTGSSLSVAWRYPVKARYEGNDEAVCVAQLVRLQINAASVHIPHYEITLDEQSPEALILNASRRITDDPHNKHYEKILDGSVTGARNAEDKCDVVIETVPDWIVSVIAQETIPERLVEMRTSERLNEDQMSVVAMFGKGPESIRVECANSQWP